MRAIVAACDQGQRRIETGEELLQFGQGMAEMFLLIFRATNRKTCADRCISPAREVELSEISRKPNRPMSISGKWVGEVTTENP
jgi:hypothetical protein